MTMEIPYQDDVLEKPILDMVTKTIEKPKKNMIRIRTLGKHLIMVIL